jgi:hypothetical protein
MVAKLGSWVILGFLCASVGGCSKSDSPGPAASGGSGDGTSVGGASIGGVGSQAGSGSAGTPTFNNGPAISSAPPAWVRPADCKGIGNLCPNLSGCIAGGSSCQLEGNVCIPALVPGASSLPAKSMERPYCAAYTCMTFDEASCFCTGEAAKTEPDCTSPAALAGLCKGKGGSCGAAGTCCDGLSCVDHGGYSACEEPCQTAADCESGCCTDLYDTGVTICAKLAACENPCKKRGEVCEQGSATTPNNCCQGDCLKSETPDFDGCRPHCRKNEDCDTGCCRQYSDSNEGFCVGADWCTCSPIGAECGKGGCCEGSTCAGKDGSFSCKQLCTQASDCATGCCDPLSDNSAKVCQPPNYCL